MNIKKELQEAGIDVGETKIPKVTSLEEDFASIGIELTEAKLDPKNAKESWQKNAWEDGYAGGSGIKKELKRNDYRYNSQFNPELIRWYNAGWDEGVKSKK